MIVEQIRKFVEEECKKPTSKYGYEPYEFHFIPVYNYATELAKRLGADIEVVQIAALLHDIGSIIEGRENHHITGAKIAEQKLKELKYDKNKIELVKKCILNHRGSVKANKESKEEQIIADADSMSSFDNLPGIFKAAFVYENKNQGEAKKSVKTKLANCYEKLSPEAQKIIKPKYDAAMLLLS
jgi:uncharacterized protein